MDKPIASVANLESHIIAPQQTLSDFRADGVLVQPRQNRISRGQSAAALEPKAMAVLNALAKARGAVLSRSELLDSAWGGELGSDENLSRVISQCRSGFRKIGAKDPIRTVPRTGYAFVHTTIESPLPPQARYRPQPRAHALYLEGRTLAARISSPAELGQAVEMLEEAVSIDEGFAEGWAALAQARATAAGHSPFGNRRALTWSAEDAARHALELDGQAYRAHTVLAQVLLAKRDFSGALTAAQTAYEMSSHDAESAMWLGYIYAIIGHVERALPLLEEAVAADPLQGRRQMILAIALNAAGDFERAEQHAKIAISLNFFGAHEPYSAAAYLRSDNAEAIARFDHALDNFKVIYAREPRFSTLLKFAARGIYGGGRLSRRLLLGAAVSVAKLAPKTEEGFLPYIFLRTGSADHLFGALWNGLLPGVSVIAIYLWDRSDSSAMIRSDANFGAFADRIGLTQVWQEHGMPDCWPANSQS
ncbi:winged helix-turn-helix domain-containing protein [Altererythrobacter sp. MF3-039]|uniref:winged helix-turn-helix domain-containing protein n=1 Tax=Altererythrobacter sp. MF3-039 TaxID=3252901 RepID=UPI00390CC1C4